jgi:hypothetical protein
LTRAWIDDPGLQHLVSAKNQELPRKRGSFFGGVLDAFDLITGFGIRLEPVGQKAAVSLDDREQIVEVMGDTSCQSADRLHFLRLAELFLEEMAFGDIY